MTSGIAGGLKCVNRSKRYENNGRPQRWRLLPMIWHHMGFQYLARSSESLFVEIFAEALAKITIQLLFVVQRYPS
jgi:hypothetical protein